MTLQQELFEIEHRLWTGGPEAYEAHTDDNCLVAFKDAVGIMARDAISGMAKKGRWKEISLLPKGMLTLSDTSAVISYECTARRQDNQPYHAVVSSGYVKRSGGWRLAFHQQTPMD